MFTKKIILGLIMLVFFFQNQTAANAEETQGNFTYTEKIFCACYHEYIDEGKKDFLGCKETQAVITGFTSVEQKNTYAYFIAENREKFDIQKCDERTDPAERDDCNILKNRYSGVGQGGNTEDTNENAGRGLTPDLLGNINEQKQAACSKFQSINILKENEHCAYLKVDSLDECYTDVLKSLPDAKVGEVKPLTLSIGLPGFNPSNAIKLDTIDAGGFFYVPWIAEYIVAIFKFGLIIASILAVVMIIVSGIKVVLSGALGGEEKQSALKAIGRIAIGLAIAWGSYFILYNLNPDLVNLKSLKIKVVTANVAPESEDVTAEPDSIIVSEETVRLNEVIKDSKEENIYLANENITIAKELFEPLKKAAQIAKTNGIQLLVTSGYRSLSKQLELIQQNCSNPPADTGTCTPKPGRVPTCMLKQNAARCPHTTGKAIDVWGMLNFQQCILQKDCQTNPQSDPCRRDPCQAIILSAMKQADFCNISKEAWHFERPPMSRNCT